MAIYLNIDEAAGYLKLSKSKLYKHTAKNEIPYNKYNGRITFTQSRLDDWVTDHEQNVVCDSKEMRK